MQKYPIAEKQLLEAFAHAQRHGDHVLVFLPRLNLGEELPAIQFEYGVSLEKAFEDIATNIIPLIRAGKIGVPAKEATHMPGLTVH